MTIVLEIEPNVFVPWTGQMLNYGETQITAPPIIGEVWSDVQLAEVGLYRAVAFVPPQGKVTEGAPSYARVGDQVMETYAVVDEPPPSPTEARRTTFAADPNIADILNKLENATLAEIQEWLTTNVTTLAQARTVLGYVIGAMVLFRRR